MAKSGNSCFKFLHFIFIFLGVADEIKLVQDDFEKKSFFIKYGKQACLEIFIRVGSQL